MKRLHLFEFEDFPWFPVFLRDMMTDYLSHVANSFDLYKPLLPTLHRTLQSLPSPHIVDLASGGGGGLVTLARHLREEHPDLTITLTDYYPNIAAFQKTVSALPDVFQYESDSVDALDVPSHLRGLRTQFLSLHHFRPDAAQSILQNAVDSRAPILLVEAQNRDLSHLIRFAFSPLFVLLLTPMIRPLTFARLLFTYIIPLVPLFVFWDGLVSVLRTYTTDELHTMVQRLDQTESFVWEIERNTDSPSTVLYILGVPRDAGAL